MQCYFEIDRAPILYLELGVNFFGIYDDRKTFI